MFVFGVNVVVSFTKKKHQTVIVFKFKKKTNNKKKPVIYYVRGKTYEILPKKRDHNVNLPVESPENCYTHNFR